MVELLLMASIACHDGWKIIDRVKKDDNIDNVTKREIIREIKNVMDCYDDKETNKRGKG